MCGISSKTQIFTKKKKNYMLHKKHHMRPAPRPHEMVAILHSILRFPLHELLVPVVLQDPCIMGMECSKAKLIF